MSLTHENLIIEARNLAKDRIGQIAVKDIRNLEVVLNYNNVGTWSITLAAGHPLVKTLRKKGSGIVIATDAGTIISGNMTSTRYEYSGEDPKGLVIISGVDDNQYLMDAIAYPDPAHNAENQAKSKDARTGHAEKVIKDFVKYNIGPSAISSRKIPSLTIEANANRGPVLAKSARYQNLGLICYEIATASELGFKIVQVNDNMLFKVYEPVDRSEDIVWSIENNNITNSYFEFNAPVITNAIVGGKGAGVNRLMDDYSTTSSNAEATAWGRRIEVFVDEKTADTSAELTQAGLEAISGGLTTSNVEVTPKDAVSGFMSSWDLGDIIRVKVNDEIELTSIIDSVGILMNNEGITIKATVNKNTRITSTGFSKGILGSGSGGANGINGEDGQGFTYRGEWNSATAYKDYDVVVYNGSSYVALENNTNIAPDSSSGGTTNIDNDITDSAYWSHNEVTSVGVDSVTLFNSGDTDYSSILNKTSIQNSEWETLEYRFRLSIDKTVEFLPIQYVSGSFYAGIADTVVNVTDSYGGFNGRWFHGVGTSGIFNFTDAYRSFNVGKAVDNTTEWTGDAFTSPSWKTAEPASYPSGLFGDYIYYKIVLNKIDFNPALPTNDGVAYFYYKLGLLDDWTLVETVDDILVNFPNTGTSYLALGARSDTDWTIAEVKDVHISITQPTLPNTSWGLMAAKGDKGDTGDTGPAGADGAAGAGVAAGGTAGMLLSKVDDTDYNTIWTDSIDCGGSGSGTAFSATGGTITTAGGYKYHTFTSSGSFDVTGSGSIDYLVVAGGAGGGGGAFGGGGGAGGLLTGTTTVSTSTNSIVIGSGGAGGSAILNNTANIGVSGGNSTALGLTAIGGGGGGGYAYNGVNGGSGGGSNELGTGGTGTGSQGTSGGNGATGTGGGGGGSASAGVAATSSVAGNGGDGTLVFGNYYAAGGGAGKDLTKTSGIGGSGIGGDGGAYGSAGTNAVANTGSGGGGASWAGTPNLGGNGSDGIVIIRYAI